MRSRSVAVVVSFSVCALSAGGAIGAYVRAQNLRTEGNWLLLRSNAAATEYASSLDSSAVEGELLGFEQRRGVLERAHLWQRAQMSLVLVAGIAALAGYLLHLRRRLERTLEQAGPEAAAPEPKAPAR